jgi:hypothetical protein
MERKRKRERRRKPISAPIESHKTLVDHDAKAKMRKSIEIVGGIEVEEKVDEGKVAEVVDEAKIEVEEVVVVEIVVVIVKVGVVVVEIVVGSARK